MMLLFHVLSRTLSNQTPLQRIFPSQPILLFHAFLGPEFF